MIYKPLPHGGIGIMRLLGLHEPTAYGLCHNATVRIAPWATKGVPLHIYHTSSNPNKQMAQEC